ncbi:MAG: hypothetical protein Q9208_006595 [Pyrenodesmia sp. 3 TL-2023]
MDPITGVSLVASVATLVTFSIDTVQTLRKVYEQGSTGKYEDVEYTSDRLASLARSLQQSMQGASTVPSTLASAERELIAIGRKCEDCAQALQHELGKLHAQPRSSLFAAARKTARSVWSRRKIEEISTQLETYRATLETSLLYQLRHALLTHNNLASLETGLQHVVKCLADSNTSLAKLTTTGFDQLRIHTTSQIQGLEQRQQDQRMYDETMKSLFYPDIFSRQEQVDHEFDGIQNTYEWVFQQPETQDGSPSIESPSRTAIPRWDDFPLWLKSGQGLYWINGKAGSGKSTLMNYICQHDLRLDLLKEWCVDRVLLTPAYFFWAAGNEMEGQYESTIRIIRDLSSTDNVKVCLSSRPLLVFEEAFSKAPGLRLQDLTFRSLQAYAEDRLSNLIQARLLHSQHDGDRAQDLLNTIVERADGVFLWAVIAIRDVREGLQDFADLDELAQAINSLPPQLESLFMLMLHRIKPAYQRDAARFLQIIQFQSLNVYWWGLSGFHPMDLCKLYFIHSHGDFAKTTSAAATVPFSSIAKACSILQTQLLSHTAGLLELTPVRHDNTDETSVLQFANEEQMMKTRVNFLHRSARDFLLQNDEAKSFLARKGFTEAGVHLAIAKGILAQFERFPAWDIAARILFIDIASALRHIALAERLLGAAQSRLMQSLGDASHLRTYNVPRDKIQAYAPYAFYETEKGRVVFDVVGMAASTAMTFYVCEQLGISIASQDYIADPSNLSDNYISTTSPATLKWTESGIDTPTVQTTPLSYRQNVRKRLQLDLESQSDPLDDQSPGDSEGRSPREDAGSRLLPRWANEAFAETYLLACCTPGCHELVRIFLRAGANPMVGVDTQNQQYPASCFWNVWLDFLDHARLRYRMSFGKTGGLVPCDGGYEPQLTPEIVFDITRLQVLNGADINHSMYHASYMVAGWYFKRSLPPHCRLAFKVECTAMFILEECFNDKPEFRRLAAAVEPRVKRPARWPSGVDGKLFAVNHDLLWPLLEKWEKTGYDHDLEALQSAVERVLGSRQSGDVGDEEFQAAIEEMAQRETEKTRTL